MCPSLGGHGGACFKSEKHGVYMPVLARQDYTARPCFKPVTRNTCKKYLSFLLNPDF